MPFVQVVRGKLRDKAIEDVDRQAHVLRLGLGTWPLENLRKTIKSLEGAKD